MPATAAEQTFFKTVIAESFNYMLQRSTEDGYLNTKFDVIDGTDYTNAADPELKSEENRFARENMKALLQTDGRAMQ